MKNTILYLLAILSSLAAFSQDLDMVSDRSSADLTFPILGYQYPNQFGVAPIYVDPKDYWLVGKAASLLQQDIHRITGLTPPIITDLPSSYPIPFLIIIGSLEQSPVMQRLARHHMIQESLSQRDQWESYVLKTVRQPVIGVGQALVIAGSDRRGTAYGIFELSRQMGVSPWYWWADVPIQKKARTAICVSKRVFQIRSAGGRNTEASSSMTKHPPCASAGSEKNTAVSIRNSMRRYSNCYFGSKPIISGRPCGAAPSTRMIRITRYSRPNTASSWAPPTMNRCSGRSRNGKRLGSGAHGTKPDQCNRILDSFWTKGHRKYGPSLKASSTKPVCAADGDKPMKEGRPISHCWNVSSPANAPSSEKSPEKILRRTPAKSWALYKEVQDYVMQ